MSEQRIPERPKNYDSIRDEALACYFDPDAEGGEPFVSHWSTRASFGLGYDAGMRWATSKAEATITTLSAQIADLTEKLERADWAREASENARKLLADAMSDYIETVDPDFWGSLVAWCRFRIRDLSTGATP